MKMRNIAANMLTVLIVAGLVLLGAFGLYRSQVTAKGPHKEDVVFIVKKGARFDSVADDLAAAGAVNRAWIFRVSGRLSGQARKMRFGEYRIPAGASTVEVIDLLTRGGNVRHLFTMPEGTTVAMAVANMLAEPKLTGEIDEVPAEGTLFPETWDFQRGEKRSALIGRMRTQMQKVLDEAWAQRSPNHPLQTKEQLLILASIIEKETRPQEHGKVASVFVNRLIRGMRLQTDPTVIYGITKGKYTLGRGLKVSELKAKTPYNTYEIDGLPPTPICNPSRLSLMAAARPEQTNYLYFVADGTGGHAFAETLDEHNRNVARWRKIEAERKTE